MTLNNRVDLGRVQWPKSVKDLTEMDMNTFDDMVLCQYVDHLRLRILDLDAALQDGAYLFDVVDGEVSEEEGHRRRMKMIHAKAHLQARHEKASKETTRREQASKKLERVREHNRGVLAVHDKKLERAQEHKKVSLAVQSQKLERIRELNQGMLAIEQLKTEREEERQKRHIENRLMEIERQDMASKQLVSVASVMATRILTLREHMDLPSDLVTVAGHAIGIINDFDMDKKEPWPDVVREAMRNHRHLGRVRLVNSLRFFPKKCEIEAAIAWIIGHHHADGFEWGFCVSDKGTRVMIRCDVCGDHRDCTSNGGED